MRRACESVHKEREAIIARTGQTMASEEAMEKDEEEGEGEAVWRPRRRRRRSGEGK